MKYVPIYVLRSRCLACNLDTMRSFVLTNNENPDEAFKQMERWVTRRWPKEHNCTHTPLFNREKDPKYHYNVKKKEAQRI